MTYWRNEIGDRISLFNLADICPKGVCQNPPQITRINTELLILYIDEDKLLICVNLCNLWCPPKKRNNHEYNHTPHPA